MMKIPEFEGLFDMHSEYLLPGMLRPQPATLTYLLPAGMIRYLL